MAVFYCAQNQLTLKRCRNGSVFYYVKGGKMFRITCYDSEGYPITHLTQWDIDQTLVVEDSYILEHQGKLPNFHFCNKNSESALVVETKLDEQGRITADVPNILLQQGTPIIAYVYIYGLDGVEGYAKSLYTIRLPVRPRPKPDDYMYTETEILTWQRLEERMKKLIQEVSDDLQAHKEDKANPHEVTKAQVGLGNVDNTSDMDKPISTATQAALDDITDNLDNHKNDKNNPHEVTKAQIGLGDVDNTSDADKPISTAAQEALDGKADLGEDGKLLPEQLSLTVEPSDDNGSIIINGQETKIYTHPTDPGNKHVPAGGSEGQILEWASNGAAKWTTPRPDGSIIVSSDPPDGNESTLWIDTENGGVAKYWDGSTWIPTKKIAVWGGDEDTEIVNVTSPIGEIYEANDNISIPSNISTTAVEFTVPAGVYVVTANAEWTISSSAFSCACILVGGSSVAIERGTMNAGGGHSLSTVVTAKSENVIALMMYSGESDAVTVRAKLKAIRIK